MDRTQDSTTREDRVAALLLALGSAIENRPRISHRAWIVAVPVVLVNYVAFRAQLRFWQDHLSRIDALLVSVALESIAVYWTWLAHQALIADDSALRPRLAAYGMALVIGALNYSHYMRPGWRPTVAAVTFGMMSVISPWLWAGYTRRISRDRLKSLNRIEEPAVRLGVTRWFWHAYRCIRVMRAATWTGENRPAEAIALYEQARQGKARLRADRVNQAGQDEPPVNRGKATATMTPPPDLAAGEPPPGAAAADGAEAQAPGLAAARDIIERRLARELIASGRALPAERELARHPELAGSESTRRRAARRILADAQAGMDGNSHERVNGS